MSDNFKKILVVDDNTADLTIINGILGDRYKVYPVDSSVDALKFLTKQSPDMILLDLEMPRLGGDNLLHIVRANVELKNVPIIFITAHNEVEIEAAAFKDGASDFMRKPISDIVLLSRIERQFELKELRERVSALDS